MDDPKPVLTAHLFPELLAELTLVLTKMPEAAWGKATACPGWTVHDVTLHLLDGELGTLSRGRDRFLKSLIETETPGELVRLLNEKNERWVGVARGISPRLVVDLLSHLGNQTAEHYASVDPDEMGSAVTWASTQSAPRWLSIARGYTERWLHQQHIREAVDAPLLLGSRFYSPVLATFVHSLPRAYEGTTATDGTVVRFSVRGESGGEWFVAKEKGRWRLSVSSDTGPECVAAIEVQPADAWRMFTKGIDRRSMLSRVQVEGNELLALKALDAVAILA